MKLKSQVKNSSDTTPSKDFGAMNPPEVQSAKDADRKAVETGATSGRLDLFLGMVSQKFGLDETYTVRAFNDKGKVMNITVESEDFSVTVTVKDSERFGLFVEQ